MSALLDSLLTPAQRAEVAASQAPRIPAWISMTESERRITLHAMSRFGCRFVSRLAEAWAAADTVNSMRLGAAMADYVRAYGPGTDHYAAAFAREAA